MATLFAAVDARGQTRFVGDVPRGAACNCFCAFCSSPLVAKQGEALEWHFAHEAGTERPECRTGGFNLLRRLAAEEFKRRAPLSLPYFSLPHPLSGRPAVEWTGHPGGELELREGVGPNVPAGTFPLREGGIATLYVCVDRETPPAPAGLREAVLVLWVPYPGDGLIRTEAQARQFVNVGMRLNWRSLPDFAGKLAAAQDEARAWWQGLQREQADRAGARWAATRRQMAQAADGGGQSHPSGLGAPAPQTAAAAPAWAPGLVPGTSIHYRMLDDDSQWVCYKCGPEQWRLAPVPEPHDGWDEFWPPTAAVPDGPTWLRVVDFGKLLAIFNLHARASGIDSDTKAIEARFLGR